MCGCVGCAALCTWCAHPKQQCCSYGRQHARAKQQRLQLCTAPGSQAQHVWQHNWTDELLLVLLLLLQARAVVVDMEEGVINHMLKVRAAAAMSGAGPLLLGHPLLASDH